LYFYLLAWVRKKEFTIKSCIRRYSTQTDESKQFFFAKKNQKTLVYKALALPRRVRQMDKSFCFFFQIEVLSSCRCVSLKATWYDMIEKADRLVSSISIVSGTGGREKYGASDLSVRIVTDKFSRISKDVIPSFVNGPSTTFWIAHLIPNALAVDP
jgi:hypothetical protein